MTNQELEKIFDEIVGRAKEILIKKGQEYSGNSDRLGQLRKMDAIFNSVLNINKPAIIPLIMCSKHFVALSHYVGGKEDIYYKDRMLEYITDIINYLVLCYAFLEDDLDFEHGEE